MYCSVPAELEGIEHTYMSVTVTERSKALTQTLRSWVRISLEAEMFAYIVCVILVLYVGRGFESN
jgi:hypothetical protein